MGAANYVHLCERVLAVEWKEIKAMDGENLGDIYKKRIIHGSMQRRGA